MIIKSFAVAKNTLIDIIEEGEPFNLNEACDKIIANGGVLRLAPAYSVNDYMEDLQQNRVIFFNGCTSKYQRCDKEMQELASEDEAKEMARNRYLLLSKINI